RPWPSGTSLPTGLRWRGTRPPRRTSRRLLPTPVIPSARPFSAYRPQAAGDDLDDEGDGDAVCEGDGEGEPERDGVGDFDGWDEDDVEREGAGEVAATRDGTGLGT